MRAVGHGWTRSGGSRRTIGKSVKQALSKRGKARLFFALEVARLARVSTTVSEHPLAGTLARLADPLPYWPARVGTPDGPGSWGSRAVSAGPSASSTERCRCGVIGTSASRSMSTTRPARSTPLGRARRGEALRGQPLDATVDVGPDLFDESLRLGGVPDQGARDAVEPAGPVPFVALPRVERRDALQGGKRVAGAEPVVGRGEDLPGLHGGSRCHSGPAVHEREWDTETVGYGRSRSGRARPRPGDVVEQPSS